MMLTFLRSPKKEIFSFYIQVIEQDLQGLTPSTSDRRSPVRFDAPCRKYPARAPPTDDDVDSRQLAMLLSELETDDIRQNVKVIRSILLDNLNRRVTALFKSVSEARASRFEEARQIRDLTDRVDQMHEKYDQAVNRNAGMVNSCYAWMRESQRQHRIVGYDPVTRRFT
jgi:hypothetical protein